MYSGGGAMDGTPSDVDSFVIVVHNPPLPDIVRTVRLAPGQDSIILSIDVDLVGGLDTVDVSFEGYNSTTGLLLYQGSQSIGVAAGTARQQPIPVSYVGPGTGVDSVVASPGSASLAPGGTVQLTYTGFDNNAALPDDSVPVWYASSDSLVARVSRSGLVTAVANGNADVFVTAVANRALRDAAAITVTTVAPPALDLSPTSFSIQDTAGTADPLPRTVTVANTGGGTVSGLVAGTITFGAGATGWLTAGLSGTTAPATMTLQASNAGLTAGTYTATVPVTSTSAANSPQQVSVTYVVAAPPAPAPTSLSITEGYRVMRPADILTLGVTARDGQGNVLSSAGTTFVSRSVSVATVNPASGLITAQAGGSAVIVASLGALRDSMVVSVTPNGSVMLFAVAGNRAFERAAVNDTVRVLVAMDLRGVNPDKLASYTMQLNWTPAVLRFVRGDPVAGGFSAPTINTTQAASGQLTFAAIDAFGHAGPTAGLVMLIFVGNGSGNTTFTGGASEISGPAPTLTNYLPAALTFLGAVRVQ